MKQVPPVGADTLIFRCKFVQLMQGVVRRPWHQSEAKYICPNIMYIMHDLCRICNKIGAMEAWKNKNNI